MRIFPYQFIHSGYSPVYERGLCQECLECVKDCPFDALVEGECWTPDTVHNLCRGCGVCVEVCESGARSLVLDPSKGIPLDIDDLEKWDNAADD